MLAVVTKWSQQLEVAPTSLSLARSDSQASDMDCRASIEDSSHESSIAADESEEKNEKPQIKKEMKQEAPDLNR